MDYFYQSVLFLVLTLSLVHVEAIFPQPKYKLYERPASLHARALFDANATEITEKHERRSVLQRRTDLNITSMAIEFVEKNYPNLTYVINDILDDDEAEFGSVHMSQAIDNIEIENSAININIDKLTGAIISTGISVWEEVYPVNQAANQNKPLTAQEAVVKIAEIMKYTNETIDPSSLTIEKAKHGRVRVIGLPFAIDKDAFGKKVYTAITENTAELVWEFHIDLDKNDEREVEPDLYVVQIGVYSHAIVHVESESRGATYRVVPLNKQSVDDGRSLLTNPHWEKYTPGGWHYSNEEYYLKTFGNNAMVVENTDGDDYLQNSDMVNVGSDLKFDFTFSKNRSIKDNLKAGMTNAFYVVNLLHDFYYDIGFTEYYGNFECNNVVSGKGKGADPILVVVQDRTLMNRSTVTMNVDGAQSRIRLGPFDFFPPEKDSALSNDVIVHEYTHGLTHRLTGGPSKSNCNNEYEAYAMDEGFSDFFAEAVEYNSSKTKNTKFIFMKYLTNGEVQARPYPMTSSTSQNPYTYSSLSHGANEQINYHKIGHIWATMLHEVFYNVVKAYKSYDNIFQSGLDLSFYPSNKLVMRIMVDAMKLQPCNPTFINARDAILTAVEQRYEGNDKLYCLFYIGFATRGLGSKAKPAVIKSDGSRVYTNNRNVPSKCSDYL